MRTSSSVQKGEHLAAERKFPEAADIYRELLKLEENAKSAPLWCALGRMLSLDQQFYEAIDAFGAAVDLEPENPVFMALLGEALATVHEYEEAKLWFEKAAGLENKVRYLLKAGDMLAYLGKYDEALVFYTPLSSKYPENADLLHRKAKILHHLKRESDAMETVIEEIRLRKEGMKDAPNALSYAKLAAAYKRTSLWQESAETYALAVSLEPANPEYHMFLGSALIMNGKTDEGVAEYEKAADLTKEEFPTLLRIAESATKFHQYDEAIRLYTRALAIRNINGDVWAGIAYALLMLEKRTDVQAFFEMAKATGSMREIPWTEKLHKSYKTTALDLEFS